MFIFPGEVGLRCLVETGWCPTMWPTSLSGVFAAVLSVLPAHPVPGLSCSSHTGLFTLTCPLQESSPTNDWAGLFLPLLQILEESCFIFLGMTFMTLPEMSNYLFTVLNK